MHELSDEDLWQVVARRRLRAGLTVVLSTALILMWKYQASTLNGPGIWLSASGALLGTTWYYSNVHLAMTFNDKLRRFRGELTPELETKNARRWTWYTLFFGVVSPSTASGALLLREGGSDRLLSVIGAAIIVAAITASIKNLYLYQRMKEQRELP